MDSCLSFQEECSFFKSSAFQQYIHPNESNFFHQVTYKSSRKFRNVVGTANSAAFSFSYECGSSESVTQILFVPLLAFTISPLWRTTSRFPETLCWHKPTLATKFVASNDVRLRSGSLLIARSWRQLNSQLNWSAPTHHDRLTISLRGEKICRNISVSHLALLPLNMQWNRTCSNVCVLSRKPVGASGAAQFSIHKMDGTRLHLVLARLCQRPNCTVRSAGWHFLIFLWFLITARSRSEV